MELVYLWVEEYKNIDHQGFNFSPRFKCEYDEEKNELTINENKEYVSIFPDNINITAIVGENGSGKSSVFEGLFSFFGARVFVVFFENQFYIHKILSHEIKVINNTEKKYEIKKLGIYSGNISPIIFSWDILKYEPVLDFASYSNRNPNILLSVFGTFSHPEYMDLNSYQNNAVMKYIEVFMKYKTDIFDFSPNKVHIKFPMKKNENGWDCKKIRKEIEKLKFPEEEAKAKKKTYFRTISKFIEKYLHDGNYEKNFTLEEYNLLLNELEHMKEILSRFSSFILDMYDDNISFFGLSHGERSILLSNALIYESVMDAKKQDILICLDEPDLSLHPEWQKKYINELVKMFSQTTKNFHFLITSHSPFILSDLPKENVIFLEKGKQVYPFKDSEQTFGANIHTLLSHGFFMDEKGLMGEFAKEKIKNVISVLNEDEPNFDKKSEVQNIINIMGEPFLKHKLEEKFNEVFLTNDEKRTAKIEQLEKELKRLKNVNSEN